MPPKSSTAGEIQLRFGSAEAAPAGAWVRSMSMTGSRRSKGEVPNAHEPVKRGFGRTDDVSGQEKPWKDTTTRIIATLCELDKWIVDTDLEQTVAVDTATRPPRPQRPLRASIRICGARLLAEVHAKAIGAQWLEK
jgi:hypothetical protein